MTEGSGWGSLHSRRRTHTRESDYDKKFLGFDRSPDFVLIQVTSTVGNNKESKLAFFRFIADELKSKLSVRPDDIMINMVYVDRSDWSFGNGDPWT